MKYIKRINEGKQLGDLYHVLDYKKLLYVLQSNTLRSYKAGGGKISTSRSKMFNSYLGDSPTSIFKLVLDGDKLSNDYKIRPYKYFSQNGAGFDEFEEQINTSFIPNIKKYIKHVVLIKYRTESLIKYPWMREEEVSNYVNSIGTRNGTLPEMVKKIKDKLDRLDIDLLVQDKTKIENNDKYIDYIINYPIKKIETKKIVLYRGQLPKERKFSYDDSLIDLDGKIITRDIVIGNLRLDLDKVKYIEINKNNLDKTKLDIKPIKTDISRDELIPYVISLRLENSGKWKVSNMRALD